MDLKEIFGEEIAVKIDEIIKAKNLTLIVDDQKKPGYIPKSRFDELIGQKNELKSQVTELSGQLSELKKSASGNEELTKKLSELEAKNSEWEGKFKKAQIESAIKLKALSEKAKDPADLLKFIDVNSIKFDKEGEILGIEEQITGLKKAKSYLFDVQASAAPPPKPGVNPSSGATEPKKNTQQLYQDQLQMVSKHPTDQGLKLQLFKLKEQLIQENK